MEGNNQLEKEFLILSALLNVTFSSLARMIQGLPEREFNFEGGHVLVLILLYVKSQLNIVIK